jgi:hypothetical protein
LPGGVDDRLAVAVDTAIEEGRGPSSMSGILADTAYRPPPA